MIKDMNMNFETEVISVLYEDNRIDTHLPGLEAHRDEIYAEIRENDDAELDEDVLKHFIDFAFEVCM